MCGIIGAFARSAEKAAVLSDRAEVMLRSIGHRGRDGSGLKYFCQGTEGQLTPRDRGDNGPTKAMLGHVRLAILDTSDAGLQPMATQDGRTWITFNGEIYNFVELRRELEIRGYRFRTGTDTEVLLACYQEYGTECLQHLNGMFAFAILDGATGKFFLARDQLGIKPLYYWIRGDVLVFASEIKSILASGIFEKKIDWEAASHYFTFLYAPNPLTFFDGIRQLEPAQMLEFDTIEGSSRLETYWRPRPRPEIARLSQPESDALLKQSLSDAVARQMRSDVPIGSFLSGGVDSTIVTGLMTGHSDQVKTYTVTFPEKAYRYYNESEIARETSRHLGTEHHELAIQLNEPGLIFSLLDHFDQPYGNPTYYLMYLISREARKHITVALCGAGGDELFAGYPRYRALKLGHLCRWMPSGVSKSIAAVLRRIPDSFESAGLRRAQSFFSGLDRDFINQYLKWTYFLSDADKRDLLDGAAAGAREESRTWFRRLYEQSELQDDGNRLLELDVHSFLVDNLLEYTDKMSMAVPLEIRVPLLDHEFVEISLNIPFRSKLRGRDTKIPLRRAFRDYFAPMALTAPKKGFNVPLAHWMRDSFDSYFGDPSRLKGELGEVTVVGGSWKSGLLRKEEIDRFRDEHRKGVQDRSYELFSIMVFDYWFSKHFS